MKDESAATVILSVERRISHTGSRDSSLDAQNDKHVLSIPSTFSQTLAILLDEYIGINGLAPTQSTFAWWLAFVED